MKVIFSKYAKLELEEAVHFYELTHEGLGRRFKEEVKKAILRIAAEVCFSALVRSLRDGREDNWFPV